MRNLLTDLKDCSTTPKEDAAAALQSVAKTIESDLLRTFQPQAEQNNVEVQLYRG